jgi:hypothetical protein
VSACAAWYVGRGADATPNDGKLLADRLAPLLREMLGAMEVKKGVAVLGRAGPADTALPPHVGPLLAVMFMAANCRCVVAAVPVPPIPALSRAVAAGYCLLWLLADGPRDGKSCSVTVPASCFCLPSRCMVALEVHPTSERPSVASAAAAAADSKAGKDSSALLPDRPFASRIAAACSRKTAVRCTCKGCKVIWSSGRGKACGTKACPSKP